MASCQIKKRPAKMRIKSDFEKTSYGYILTVKGFVGHASIGSVSAQSSHRKGYLTIGEAYIMEQYQRKGYGRLLYRRLAYLAKKKGWQGLRSDPCSRNDNSNGLWRKIATHRAKNGWCYLVPKINTRLRYAALCRWANTICPGCSVKGKHLRGYHACDHNPDSSIFGYTKKNGK